MISEITRNTVETLIRKISNEDRSKSNPAMVLALAELLKALKD